MIRTLHAAPEPAAPEDGLPVTQHRHTNSSLARLPEEEGLGTLPNGGAVTEPDEVIDAITLLKLGRGLLQENKPGYGDSRVQ